MEYITVTVHTPELLRPRCAAALINLARHSWGKEPWKQMDAELFLGSESLWIVRPCPRCFIADYALPYLAKYRSK